MKISLKFLVYITLKLVCICLVGQEHGGSPLLYFNSSSLMMVEVRLLL